MKIDRLIEVIDQNCWLLREAGELACDARAQHPRTSRLVAIQRRVKVVKSGKGPPVADARDKGFEWPANSNATTLKRFSMPSVRWSSTPFPTSVRQGPIFSTVRW